VISRFSWSVVLRGQLLIAVSQRSLWSWWSVVEVSCFSWSVSRLRRRGQSFWSVVLRGWCLYSMVVMHTYLLRHMVGKTAVNVRSNVRGRHNTCRWA